MSLEHEEAQAASASAPASDAAPALTLETAYVSRIGRRSRNEDACGYWHSEQAGCWVVSDGAGGHGSGDRAAQIVVSTVLERFSQAQAVDDVQAAALLEAAQQAVMGEKRAHPEGDNMHATAAVLLIDLQAGNAVWSHVGDTRIYLFRNGRVLHQTRDHSLVQGMIDAGYGNPDMIRTHPQRSLLTSAIGHEEGLTLDVSGTPLALETDDAFLICTDGWWEYVDEADMLTCLHDSQSSADWLERMALIIAEHDTARSDNYTAIAVRARISEDPTTVLRI